MWLKDRVQATVTHSSAVFGRVSGHNPVAMETAGRYFGLAWKLG